MSISSGIVKLATLDPNEKSITYNPDKSEWIVIRKRSAFCNFFRWVIHMITCSHFVRNKDLDKISKEIFDQIQSSKQWKNKEEKELTLKAIRHLQIIIQKNGGSQEKKISQLLSTLEKIEIEQTITKERKSEKTDALTETQGKNHLEGLPIAPKNPEKDLFDVLSKVRPTLKLKDTQKENLQVLINSLEKQSWTEHLAAEGSPEAIQLIVENAPSDSQVIRRLFVQLTYFSINPMKLNAFVKSFINCQSLSFNPYGLLKYLKLPSTLTTIKQHLKAEDLKNFLKKALSLVRANSFSCLEFGLKLVDSLDESYRKMILESFLHFNSGKYLAQLYNKSQPEDSILPKILKMNPPLDKDDCFFIDFLKEIKNIESILEYVLENEPASRIVIFFNNFPDEMAAKHVLKFSKNIMAKASELKLKSIARLIANKPNLNDEKKHVAASLEKCNLSNMIFFHQPTLVKLFDYFSTDFKINILTFILDHPYARNEFLELNEKIILLGDTEWERAALKKEHKTHFKYYAATFPKEKFEVLVRKYNKEFG